MKKMKENRTSTIITHNLLIAVLAIIWLIPIVWLVCTSFSAYEGMDTSSFFTKAWSVINYIKLFHPDSVAQFPRWFMNTLVIACCNCVISTLFVLMVAYATSVMRFPMRKPLMNMAVILNLFPGMLAMIAVYFTLKTFNLTNSYIGLILVYSASSGLGYLIAKGFFDTVPRALCESARIDGCSEARILFPDGAALKPAHRCIYGYQQLPGTMDGFRIREDDPQRRYFLPVYGGCGIVQDAGQEPDQYIFYPVLCRRRPGIHSDLHSVRHHAEVPC